MFNILAEEKIPFAELAFKNLGNVTLCKGNRLTAKDLKCVDILLIRSGTRVDHGLLDGTPVQFVASPTAGTDHVNQAYLREKGIPFYHAPGCNADSVVEYVISSLFHLSIKKEQPIRGKTVGIIGLGNVGGRLAKRLQALGFEIIVNDPPKFDERGEASPFRVVELEELLENADIVSCHTPLVRNGSYPTYHLLDERRLMQMKPNAWLINAARGAVVSNAALKAVRSNGHLGALVLDVWENEPAVDLSLMELVDLATPHIAGHSYEGKVNGTIQIYEALTNHYNLDGGWSPASVLAPTAEDALDLQHVSEALRFEEYMHEVVKQMYDIEQDDQRFRQSLNQPPNERGAYFLALRKGYPRRRCFDMFSYPAKSSVATIPESALIEGLQLNVHST